MSGWIEIIQLAKSSKSVGGGGNVVAVSIDTKPSEQREKRKKTGETDGRTAKSVQSRPGCSLVVHWGSSIVEDPVCVVVYVVSIVTQTDTL